MIDLEHVLTGDGVERNFDKLRSLVPDTGGQSIRLRFGMATLSFTASSDSNVLDVAHGMDPQPLLVIAGGRMVNGVASHTAHVGEIGATTFELYAKRTAAATEDLDFPWLAIG
jgi:hypothetical protein